MVGAREDRRGHRSEQRTKKTLIRADLKQVTKAENGASGGRRIPITPTVSSISRLASSSSRD
jgi:hypothetical protein